MKIAALGWRAAGYMVLALGGASCLGEMPEEKGLAIAQEAARRDEGWGDYSAIMRMVLRSSRGQESTRTMRIRSREVANDGDQSLTIFDRPRDVRGTAFLSHAHALRPDDQWLYLPALKRVKRIASANKSGPFMGSEFAYEDVTSSEVEKFSYRWLRDERLGEVDAFVLETVPRYEYSGYTRQVTWLDKQTYRTLKTEFYDRKNALLKTLSVGPYRLYLGKYWRPDKMSMVNHQTGKETDLFWDDYQFANGYGTRDFDRSALDKIR